MNFRRALPLGSLALAAGLAALPPRAHADDDAKNAAFRDTLTQLLDRFNDDAGDRMGKAIELCQAHLKECPGDGNGHLQLARLFLAKPDLDGANAEVAKVAAGTDAEQTKTARAIGFLALMAGMDVRFAKESEGKTDAEKKKIVAKLRGEVGTAQQSFIDACGSKDAAIAVLRKESAQKDSLATLAEIGKPPRAIGKKDTDGKEIDLSAYTGKVVLIDFWATWCGPCVGELPNVLKTYATYHARGFEVVGISLDQDRGKLDAFLKAKDGMTWRQYFDGKGWKNDVAVAWGVQSIPKTYLLDHTGKVRYVGARGEALGPAVLELLERAEKAGKK